MGFSLGMWFLAALRRLRLTCKIFRIKLSVLWLTHLTRFISWEEQILGLIVLLNLFIQMYFIFTCVNMVRGNWILYISWPLYHCIRRSSLRLSCCICLSWSALYTYALLTWLHWWIFRLFHVHCHVQSGVRCFTLRGCCCVSGLFTSQQESVQHLLSLTSVSAVFTCCLRAFGLFVGEIVGTAFGFSLPLKLAAPVSSFSSCGRLNDSNKTREFF